MVTPPDKLDLFESLVTVVSDLRGPNGCPWDKEQTHKSLTRYAVEECYEFIEAVNNNDYQEMKDELGDLLLQVILHAQIASENNNFDIADVIESINQKMIRRHPHVYKDVSVSGSDEVLTNWDEIKQQEKKDKPQQSNTFGIPSGMAPLIKSVKLGEKAAKQKFDWDNPEQIIAKIKEETQEVEEAMEAKNIEEITNEIGDVLFATCQLARKHQINPEEALQRTNKRFEQRFFKMKALIESEGKLLENLGLNEMETYWQKVKS